MDPTRTAATTIGAMYIGGVIGYTIGEPFIFPMAILGAIGGFALTCYSQRRERARKLEMFGPPDDVAGECNAHLYISDDYGDNHATMRCQLPEGHDGKHQEKFERDGSEVVVTWEKDEKDAT